MKANEVYGEMAGWEHYVAPLANELEKVPWERIMQQVAESATTPHPLKDVAVWRTSTYERLAKEEAIEKERSDKRLKYQADKHRVYLALRLNRISQMLGTNETQRYLGPQGYFDVTRWRPDGAMRLVLDGPPAFCNDRHVDTVGKALGLVDWFRHCLREFEEAENNALAINSSKSMPSQSLLPPPETKGASPLSLRQVALFYAYNDKVIPKAADEIAKEYGHQSGAKLYLHYLTVSQRAGRIGDDVTGQKLPPMIKDIAAVIPRLSGKALQKAQSEMQTLEARK